MDKFVTAYMDDVFIYLTNNEEYHTYVEEVVRRFHRASIWIAIEKCEFETTKVRFLDLVIISKGIEMDSDKVKAIADLKSTYIIKDLPKCLGFVNFHKRFI